jgi:hypothetical protein
MSTKLTFCADFVLSMGQSGVRCPIQRECHTNPWRWQGTEFKMISGVMSLSTVGITLNLPPSTTAFGGVRQVGFNVPNFPVVSASNPDNMNVIKDLCSTLSTKCPGFLDEDEHRFVIYPGLPRISSTCHSTVTLDTLL